MPFRFQELPCEDEFVQNLEKDRRLGMIERVRLLAPTHSVCTLEIEDSGDGLGSPVFLGKEERHQRAHMSSSVT